MIFPKTLRLLFLAALAAGLRAAPAAARPTMKETKEQNWFHKHLYDDTNPLFALLRAGEDTWYAASAPTIPELSATRNASKPDPGAREIIIPIYPSVAPPGDDPEYRLYYETIVNSGIRKGDKVLVIGAGTGSDAWLAWLKSESPVYVVEINPMAIANTYATARIAGFEVRQVLGDVAKKRLPPEFSGFDFVIWNMPFVEDEEFRKEQRTGECWDTYQYCDNGDILKAFIPVLPKLVKNGGRALLLNSELARPMFPFENIRTRSVKRAVIYDIGF